MNKKFPWTMSTLNAILTGLLFFLLDRRNNTGAIIITGIILISIILEIVIVYKSELSHLKPSSSPIISITHAGWIVFSFSLAYLLSYLTVYFLLNSQFNFPGIYLKTDNGIDFRINLNQVVRGILFVYMVPLISGNLGAWIGLRLLTQYKSFRTLFLGVFLSALLFPMGACLLGLFTIASYPLTIKLQVYLALTISILAVVSQMIAMKR